MLMDIIGKMGSELILLKLPLHLPGFSELMFPQNNSMPKIYVPYFIHGDCKLQEWEFHLRVEVY